MDLPSANGFDKPFAASKFENDKLEFDEKSHKQGENKMKKKIIILLIGVIGVLLTACGGDGQSTYYPSCSEMQENLQNKHYEVNVQTIQNDVYSGTCLIAEKGDEYIEFYWLDSCDTITSIEQDLITKYPDYNKLVSMENDSKFGTFIFCSSEKAMDDAGIVIVDVKVKVS